METEIEKVNEALNKLTSSDPAVLHELCLLYGEAAQEAETLIDRNYLRNLSDAMFRLARCAEVNNDARVSRD